MAVSRNSVLGSSEVHHSVNSSLVASSKPIVEGTHKKKEEQEKA